MSNRSSKKYFLISLTILLKKVKPPTVCETHLLESLDLRYREQQIKETQFLGFYSTHYSKGKGIKLRCKSVKLLKDEDVLFIIFT
jgi:hypothetical protein